MVDLIRLSRVGIRVILRASPREVRRILCVWPKRHSDWILGQDPPGPGVGLHVGESVTAAPPTEREDILNLRSSGFI